VKEKKQKKDKKEKKEKKDKKEKKKIVEDSDSEDEEKSAKKSKVEKESEEEDEAEEKPKSEGVVEDPENPDAGKTELIVTNMGAFTWKDGLKKFFEIYGTLIKCKHIYDMNKAWIEYGSHEEAAKA